MRLAAAAAQTCARRGANTSNTTWGSLGPPGFQLFGNSFDAAGTYTDCYQFNLDASAKDKDAKGDVDIFLLAQSHCLKSLHF